MTTLPARLAGLLFVLTLLVTATIGCGTNVKGAARVDRVRGLRRVAVMPFAVPRNAPPELSRALADELAAHLLNARFDVVERAELEQVMQEQAFQMSDDVDPATVVRIGALAGADGVVLGRVTDYRDEATGAESTTLGISVRCVQAQTGSLIFTSSAAQNAAAAFCGSEMNCLRAKMVTEIGAFVIDATR
jgi:curli biogenesis system outer membrane secretion channel CsgG